MTRNAVAAGRPEKKNKKTQKRKQPSNDSTLDLTFSPTFDSASTPVKRMKVSNTMQTSPITPDVTDATTSPFVKETLRQVHELSAPLSKDEEAYLTKLTRIKMNQSSDKVTIRCKTGGPPLVFKKITQPRKPSTQATSPLKKKRVKFMDRLRMNLSGNTADDAVKQQGAELKSTTKPKRKRILEAAGCKLGTVSEKEGPAPRMKLGLSLTKYRVQKKFFRSIGVRFASEQKERQQQTEAMCGEIRVERRSLEFWNEDDSTYDLEQTPVATITDIPQYVTELLDQYDKENQLTWHNSTIPEDEVWVKLGGDRGGGTFKLMLQIANLRRPNSKHNTCLLAIAECKDTPDNLRRITGPYKHQITELETMQWRDKNIRLFWFGDYEFLLKCFGLSGAQANHPCLFCTASRAQIQAPPQFNEGNITSRSLRQIRTDYRKYRRLGKNKKHAKRCRNVVRKPLIDFEPSEQAAPTTLHILLGVVKKHHDLLEKECHSLDKLTANSLARANRVVDFKSTPAFEDYVQQLKKTRKMKREKRHLQQRLLELPRQLSDSLPLTVLQKRTEKLSTKI